jgi:hypothetical protein
MGLIEAFWHALNFLAPALAVAALAAGAVKGLWRHDLAHVAWAPMAGAAAGVGSLVLLLGLMVHGRDGRMSTYAVMCLAITAMLLWWAFFKRH